MELAFVGKDGVSKAPKARPELGFAILSHSNLKSHEKVAAAQAHNLREMPCPDTRADGHPPVELLTGMTGDYVARVTAVMNAHNVMIRPSEELHTVYKGQTLAFEDVYSASLEYWNRNGDWKAKTAEEVLADPLVERVVGFAKWRHGKKLFSVTVHLDEETPHFHVLSVALHRIETRGQGRLSKDPNKQRPLVWRWTLCAGSKVRGGGWALNKAQTLWAEYVSDLGLERGRDTSQMTKEERKEVRDAKHPKSSMLEKKRRLEHEAKMAEAQAKLDLGNELIKQGQKLIADATAKGQAEADRVVAAAKAQAAQIVADARRPITDAQAEAERIKADAKAAAEREAKAIIDGAEAHVQAAAKAASEAAEAEAKKEAARVLEEAKAAAQRVRDDALAWARDEAARVDAEKAAAAKARAEAEAAKKALDGERDAILQAARDEAATIKAAATKGLEDREAKANQRAKELDGREAGIKGREDALEADRQVARDMAAEFGRLGRKVTAALAPLEGYLKAYREAPVADKLAMGPKVDRAREALNSEGIREFNRIMEAAKNLASGKGR
jgi:hypothetical protein